MQRFNGIKDIRDTMETPSIAEFYRGRSLFITGVTGFMGKVLLEKLLRSCPDLHTCYVLIRPKKGLSVTERLEQLLQSKLFERLIREQPDFSSKIVPIAGDILEPRFGISEPSEKMLCDKVSIVFHSAATVKFDEELKLSVQMNVIGVQRLMELTRKMHHLEAVVHVSTAYSNCHRKMISEMVYDPPLHPQKLIDAIGWLDNDAVNSLTQKLVGKHPNTYTYTKAMAEYLIVEEKGDLPIAIVRPSIVGASLSEPIAGWVDNFNGPTGALAAIGKGLLRMMCGNRNGIADIIPVDIAVKLMIAIAWDTAVNKTKQTLVYNNTTGQINKFTWGQLEKMSFDFFMKNPVEVVARTPNPRFTKYVFWKDLNVLFDHMLPAYLMDIYMWLVGRKPIFVKIQDRLWKAIGCFEFFTSHEWHFNNDNVFRLYKKLSESDKKDFDFGVSNINWGEYMENYCLGTKQFVLKENMDSLPKARKSLQRLQRFRWVFNTFMVIVVWRLMLNRVRVAKSLWNLLMRWIQWVFHKIPMLAKSS